MNAYDKNRASEPDADKASAGDGKPVSRRVMLRGAAAAVPAILTLHSGSALAVSSNLMSVSNEITGNGPAMCLDTSSLKSAGTAKFDLGDPAKADITSIRTDRTYYKDANLKNAVTPQEMCKEGGTYYYNADTQAGSSGTDDSLFSVRINGESADKSSATLARATEAPVTGRGGFISATALASFFGGSGITIRDI